MTAVRQGEVLSGGNPKFVFYAQREGRLEDLASLGFQIFDKSDPLDPVEKTVGVQPVTLTDYPAGARIGRGRYALPYTIPSDARAGRWEVRWTYEFTDGPSGVARIDFDVLETASGIIYGPAYAFVADLRDEGAPKSLTDARLQNAIVLASRFIEMVTRRFFDPRYVSVRYDGSGKRAILLTDPIIALDRMALESDPSLVPDFETDPSFYRIFNRHLRGLMMPDDRDSPKIEFVHTDDLLGVIPGERFAPAQGLSLRSLTFPYGNQNVLLEGVFGYTEDVHNGAPWGDTPVLLRHLAKLLAYRELGKLGGDCRDDAREGWRVTEKSVRDQTIRYSTNRMMGGYTGDPEIDTLLSGFMRPPMMAGV